MIEKTATITIEDLEGISRTFRLDRITADLGNWVVTQMLAGRARMDGVTQKLEGILLDSCFFIKNTDAGPVPVKAFEAGRVLIPELTYDLWTRNQLCEEVMKFNFDPFFERLKKKQKQENEREQALTSGTPLPDSLQ